MSLTLIHTNGRVGAAVELAMRDSSLSAMRRATFIFLDKLRIRRV
jgi:hypothetical protein